MHTTRRTPRRLSATAVMATVVLALAACGPKPPTQQSPGGPTVEITCPPSDDISVNDASPAVRVTYTPVTKAPVDLTSFRASIDGVDLTSEFLLFESEATLDLQNIIVLDDGPHVLEVEIANTKGKATIALRSFVVSTAGETTQIRGTVRDALSQAPVVGAEVYLAGAPAIADVTASDGSFVLDGPPAGKQLLKVDGSGASNPNGQTYANYSVPKNVTDGQVLDIFPAIYLPPIDPAGTVEITEDLVDAEGCALADIVIENPVCGVKITIAQGTEITFPDGSSSGQSISITEVPKAFTPSELPEEVDPPVLITFQPSGLELDAATVIEFPNPDGWAPGNEAILLSFDHDAGVFVESGTLTVEAGGVSGPGPSAGGWHCPCPPAPGPDGGPDDDCQDCDCPLNPLVDLYQGTFRHSVPLPAVKRLDRDSSVTLHYSSAAAKPEPVVSSLTVIPVQAAVPPSVELSVTILGSDVGSPLYFDTAGLSESVATSFHTPYAFDASFLESGLYKYQLRAKSVYPTSSSSAVVAGDRLPIVNWSENSTGRGWSHSLAKRLHFNAPPRISYESGDGRLEAYDPAPVTFFDWNQEGSQGAGNWSVSSDGSSVLQTVNGQPTFFISNAPFGYGTFAGTLRVETSSDDDFIGFVFGYNSPLSENGDPTNDYDFLLFDWKRGNQSGASAGMTLSRVDGTITDNNASFWLHQESEALTVLAKDWASSNGWESFVEYDFSVTYAADHVAISIDGEEIFDVGGSFPAGRVGFYNYSQSQVRYTGFSSTEKFESTTGDLSTISKSASGEAYRRVLSDGSSEEYDLDGRLISITDRSGNTSLLTYDGDRLTSVTNPLGESVLFGYDAGLLASIVDEAGRTTSLTHNSNGEVTRIDLPDGSTEKYTYDDGRMTTFTDRAGEKSKFALSPLGRVTEVELADGFKRDVQAAKLAGFTSADDADGSTESPLALMLMDVEHSIVSTSDSTSRMLEYGANGPTAVEDELGRVSTFVRDDRQRVTFAAGADGISTTYDYNPVGNLAEVITSAPGETDEVTRYTYHPTFNSVTGITYPNGIINPETGVSLAIEYDEAGNHVRTIDVFGMITEYHYDEGNPLPGIVGRLTSITRAVGRPEQSSVTFEYDPLTGNTSRIVDDDGVTFAFTYDGAGNALAASQGSLADTSVVTNALAANRLAALVDALGATTHFSYDKEGNLSEVLDALNQKYLMKYDTEDRMTELRDPNGKTDKRSYTTAGELQQRIDRKGQRFTYTYDEAHQLVEVEYPGLPGATGNTKDRFGYDVDDNGTVDGTEDLVHVIESAGEGIVIHRDAMQRPRIVEYTGTNSVTLHYNYGLGGLVDEVLIEDVDGTDLSHLRFGYDALQRTTSVEQLLTGNVAILEYDALSRLARRDLNGMFETLYDYTPGGLLETITHRRQSDNEVISQYSYDFDTTAKRTQLLTSRPHLAPGTVVEGYTYDLASRLTSVTSAGQETALLTYDPMGNVLSDGGAALATYAKGDRLTNDGTWKYTYDNNGNRTSRTSLVDAAVWSLYRYDAQNRLTEFEGYDGTLVRMTYDPLGRVIRREEVGISATRYIWNGEQVLLEIDDATGLPTARFMPVDPLNDIAFAEVDLDASGALAADEAVYFLADALGSVLDMTSDSGVVRSIELSTHGALLSETSSGNNLPTIGFTGHRYDAAAGLAHMRNRFYDPTSRSFIQEDPLFLTPETVSLGVDASIAYYVSNRYGYARQDPINFNDPTGLSVQVCTRPLQGYEGVFTRHCFIKFDNYDTAGFFDTSVVGEETFCSTKQKCFNVACPPKDPCKEECVRKAVEKSKKKKHSYSVGFNNCCSWVQDILAECGLKMPVCPNLGVGINGCGLGIPGL